LGTADLNAESNYWGTSDASVIAAKVHDWNDDSSYGFVDYTPHETAIITSNAIAPPSGVSGQAGPTTMQLSWTANSESDIAGYKVYYDTDGSGYPYANSVLTGSKDATYTLTGLTTDGNYYAAVAAIDSDGNESWISSEVSVVIDNTAPEIVLIGSDSVTHEAGTAYVDAGASATDSVDGTVSVTTSGTVAISTPGTYTLTYTATDAAGNTTTATRTIIVGDTTGSPLTVTMADSQVVYNGLAQSLTPSAVDSSGNAVTVDFDVVYNNNPAVSPTHAGVYNARATINDTRYSGSTTGTLTILQAPLTITADNKIKEYLEAIPSLTLTYTGFVNSEDSSVLSGVATVGTAADEGSGIGTYGIVVYGASARNYAITHVDGTLTVLYTLGPAITLSGSATVTHEVGMAYTDAGATATDAIGDSVSVTTSGSVDVNTPGAYTITYSATDAAGNAAATVSRTVTVAADTSGSTDTRTFTSEAVTSANVDSVYSYSIITEDADGDPLDPPVLSAADLPDWLTLTDNGDGTGTLSGTPQPGDVGDHSIQFNVSIGTKVKQIYSTGQAFAALKDDGSVVKWGLSGYGGNSSAMSDELSSGVTKIYSNPYAFAALKDDGSVVTWGSSDSGGNSGAAAGGLSSGVTQIYSTWWAFAAVKSDGSVVTWGLADRGGDSSAVSDDLSSGVTKIYSNPYAFAALKDDGSVVTWGMADEGGDSSAVSDYLSSGVTHIHYNNGSFAALKNDGSVVTWGNSLEGGDRQVWSQYAGVWEALADASDDLSSGVTQIYSNISYGTFAALKIDGSVVTWGRSSYGGDTSAVSDNLSSGVAQIYPNKGSFAALKTDGSVVTWGDSTRGGDSSAVSDDLSSGVTLIYSTDNAFAALKIDGSVVTWGWADRGGDSSTVSGDLESEVTKIYSNGNAFAALKEDGSVVTWGTSSYGGDSSEVSGDMSSGVTKIYSNDFAFAALKNDGSVVTWGRSSFGGDSSAVANDLSPTYTIQDSQQFLITVNEGETQTLSLKAGWNLVSFYVEPEDAAPATVLASIKDKLVQIKNLTSSYDPSLPFFLNTLSGLSVKEGYWLKVSEAVELEVEGMVPAGASMTVKKGWNLVGYPRESGEAPVSELASLGSTVVQIKNLTSSYDPSLPDFLNTLTTMAPGLGYWLKVTENGTWTVGDVSESGSGRDIAKMGPEGVIEKKGGPNWGPVMLYPTVSATVFAQVTVAGKAVSSGSVVGAFVGKELRGQHEVVLANGRSYVTLNVNLAEAERVSYRIWDAESDKEYGVSSAMTLDIGVTYGSAEALVKLDGVVPRVGVRILSYTRSPFGFEFESESGRSYVVEATGDLREWKQVQTLKGIAKKTQFYPGQVPKTPIRYFRIKTRN
jgi:hypothetical protein